MNCLYEKAMDNILLAALLRGRLYRRGGLKWIYLEVEPTEKVILDNNKKTSLIESSHRTDWADRIIGQCIDHAVTTDQRLLYSIVYAVCLSVKPCSVRRSGQTMSGRLAGWPVGRTDGPTDLCCKRISSIVDPSAEDSIDRFASFVASAYNRPSVLSRRTGRSYIAIMNMADVCCVLTGR